MGAHSLRSGSAMAMHLIGVTPLTIVIIRRWLSDTFFLYISKQVSQFPTKVSDKILQNKEFFAVRDFDRTIREATNGAFPSSLSAQDIEKENGLPRKLGTWKPVSIGRPKIPPYMGKLVDRGRLVSGIRY